MLARALNLFERLVVAQERQAAASEKFAGVATPATPPVQSAPIVGSESLAGGTDYAALAAKGAQGYAALVGLCKDRNIEVPPRTKSATIVKQLEAWDLAHPNRLAPSASETAENDTQASLSSTGETEAADPFATTDDPLAEEPAAAPAKEYTPEEVKAGLQDFMKRQGADGAAAVVKLLSDVAGVQKLKDLPKEKYADIMLKVAA